MRKKIKKVELVITNFDSIKIFHLSNGKKVTICCNTKIVKKLLKVIPHIKDIHISFS